MAQSSLMESPEARELSLVGKVELRIALTDSDAKLQTMLGTYLVPILLKLASEHISVRNKVISLCQHINTRIKSPSIKLPIAALLKQYKDCHNSLIRHFDILYIQQGLERSPTKERHDLLPTLLRGLADNFTESLTHTSNLFNILMRLLYDLKLPLRGSKEDLGLRVSLGLIERGEDSKFVAFWIGKLFLFTSTQLGSKAHPGLSVSEYEFLTLYGKENVWVSGVFGGLSLTETKVSAAKFLASGVFEDHERFMAALYASADPNFRLSDIGDDILKRAASSISLEDHQLLEGLFSIYLGSGKMNGSLPARIPLQTRILALLGKSKEATTFTAQIVQIVKDGLASQDQTQNTASTVSKPGLGASKLRGQIFTFVNWFARTATVKSLNLVAPQLVTDLRSYVEAQGWPCSTGDQNIGELSSRSYGYESIGLLAKACAHELLLEPNLNIVQWLFTSLGCDNSGNNVSISIEQALGSILGAFSGDLDVHVETALTELLLHHMSLRTGAVDASGNTFIRSTRYAAIRFSNRCLPFRNVKARWMDILALAAGPGERSEVIDEGLKGLDPYWYRNLNPLENCATATQQDLSRIARYEFPDFKELEGVLLADTVIPDEIEERYLFTGHVPAIVFCRCVLIHQALTSTHCTPVIDVNWRINIDALIRNDETVRVKVKSYLADVYGSEVGNISVLLKFLNSAFSGLTDDTLKNAAEANNYLLELCSLCPPEVLDSLAVRILQLRSSIISNQRTTRTTASHLFGILGSRTACPSTDVSDMLKFFFGKIKFWDQAVGSQVHQVHGSILAAAYLISRNNKRENDLIRTDDQVEFVANILAVLRDCRDKELLDAAVIAIDQLCLFCVLSSENFPFPNDASLTIKNLKELAEAGHEKAVFALGHFAMQCEEDESEDSMIKHVLETLYALHEKRQPELQFAVGAALSCAAVGWRSKSLTGILDIEGETPHTSARTHILGSMLERILADCKSTKPALRQASAIWLLCLVQYCGHLDEIYGQLRSCQVAFKGHLSDRDSLNQETASRGLTLVYEKGDMALKDDLIRDLVGSFTGSNAGLAGNVSSETQLFEPGALPTGDGSVTTYRDIVNLAAEVGDSSLVYRFMSLASSNAIWTSRAAFGRFGLSNILSDSNVDGYLAQNPKLYPALFRYRFDPNANVRNSMNDIWSALVKNPQTTIESHFENIIEDLLKNVLGKEWRTRQASCAAIADLVQASPLEKYEKYLNRIWTITFKVCDDIKDSVRTAAMALARVLTGILIRSLEAGDSSANAANAMLGEVLPFLLSPSGLESSALEVQAFALKTLLQVIKSSSRQVLHPYIPELVARLLALLSSLEPQAVNYVHLNAEKYGMTAQQIDNVRLSSVKASPMMEAIERCLDMLDEKCMKNLATSLESTIRTAIGLPSRVGVSRTLVHLSTRHNNTFRPYANNFLKLLQKQVLDRNDTISTSFAAASGYLARIASEDAVLDLFEYCRKLYFDSEDERFRIVSGELVFAVAKYATDRFVAFAGDILPFAFVARNDANERVKGLFGEIWENNVGGSRAVMLYLKEILTMVNSHLGSPRWSIRHTAALAIADVITSAGTDMLGPHSEAIWPSLVRAMDGKTWNGKETVLKAFVAFAKNSKQLRSDTQIAEQMQKIVFRESRRNSPVYREHALKELDEFISLCEDADVFEQVYAITEPVILELMDNENEMDIDSQPGELSSQIITERTLANAVRTLLKSIKPTNRKNELHLKMSLRKALEQAKKTLSRNDRIIKNAVFEGEKALFEKLALAPNTTSFEGDIAEYVPTLFGLQDEAEQSRIKAAEAIAAMAAYARQCGQLKGTLGREIELASRVERSSVVQQQLDRAMRLLRGME